MLTLERVKEHLRIEHNLEDTLITGLHGSSERLLWSPSWCRKLDEFETVPATVQAGLLLPYGHALRVPGG